MALTNLVAASSLIVFLLVLTVVCRLILRSNALPATVHNVVWIFSLAALASGLITYKTFPLHAWALLAGALLAFNVGVVIVGLAWGKKSSTQSSAVLESLLSRRLFFVLLGFFAVGFLGYLYSLHARFGIMTLLTHPSEIRSAKDPSYLETVPLWARLLMYLGPLLLAFAVVPRAVKGRIPWYVRAVIVAFLGIALLALLQRTNLMMGLGYVCAAYLLTWNSPQKPAPAESNSTERDDTARSRRGLTPQLRTALVISSVLVVAFAAFIAVGFALGKTGSASHAYSPLLRATGLQNPFLYLTSGIPAFLALTDFTSTAWPPSGVGLPWVFGNFNPQTWGAATFEPIISQLPVIRPWNPIAPFTNVGVDTNIFTWYEPFYRDFRQWGVIVGSATLGAVISALFIQRWRSPAIFWVGVVMLSTVFFAPEVPKYNSTGYLFAMGVIVAISVLSWLATRVKTSRKESISASE